MSTTTSNYDNGRVSRTGERYIYSNKDYYILKKTVDGVQRTYGCFKSLKEATEYKMYCISQDWSLDCIIRKNTRYGGELRHIRRVPNSTKYSINYQYNGVYKYYGTFDTIEEAKKHRDYCEEHGWSMDCVKRRRNKYNLPKYISKLRDYYVIQKRPSKKSKTRHHQWFRNLEDAVHERDLLIRCNWDEERLMELDEAEGTL